MIACELLRKLNPARNLTMRVQNGEFLRAILEWNWNEALFANLWFAGVVNLANVVLDVTKMICGDERSHFND